MNRVFIRGKLKCLSPISIGSGLDDYTDRDVIVSDDGTPFVPGTTLAGVCRHYLESKKIKTDSLFGTLENDKESRIVFHDAFPEGDYEKSFRDSVKIGDDGTAEDGAKFDFEIIDIGDDNSYFDFRIEIEDMEENDKIAVNALICGFNSGDIRIGHKSNRGYGKVRLDNVRIKIIENIEELIEFKWEDVKEEYITTNDGGYEKLEYTVENQSFLFIADYSYYDPNHNDSNAQSLKNARGDAVIPGTAWAGVFRSHFAKILNGTNYNNTEKIINNLFGYVNGDDARESKIVFDETVLEKATFIDRTRNAIDRFTGGAGDKKLFTSRYAYGGSGDLVITLKSGKYDKDLAKELIRQTVTDLNDGYVNVGGLGSVGGGLIKICERKAGAEND